MSSSIFFRFKSQKEPQRVQFDGTSISVWDAKREIISISKLGDGTDFDLAIYNEDTNEEYGDDTSFIPRSTSVVARRLPAAKPGQGRAARYVSGRQPVNPRNSHRVEASSTPAATSKLAPGPTTNGLDRPQTEEEKIAAMFQAGSDQWEQQKQQMANASQPFRPGGFKPKNQTVPDHPPPPGYICYRCGEKGHWIQACPTNNDPTFDGRPRVKRTTGIPRSMLQTVEKPVAAANDGLTDEARQPAGVMVNADGEYVVAVPDSASWNQYQAKAQASAAREDIAASGDKELEERGLQCPIDKRMFADPMKTPCCNKTYCNDCIENALLNSDLVCPGCSTEGVLLDNLTVDEDVIGKMKAFEEDKKAEKKAAERPASPKSPVKDHVAEIKAEAESNGADADEESGPTAESQDSKGNEAESKSPCPIVATPKSPSNSKKRPAEEPLTNPRVPTGPAIPTGPAAMRKAEEQAKAQMQAQMPPGFDQSFVEQMNALAGNKGGAKSNNAPFANNMPMGMPFPMSVPPMMGMNPGMMNPMMMQQMQQYGMGMGMGMPGMNFPAMNMGGGAGFSQGQTNWQNGNTATWNQGSSNPNMGNRFGNQQLTNGDDREEAYMRKPVNPYRQGRGRKVRPTDFKEL